MRIMKLNNNNLFLLAIIVLLLPGCGCRVISWGLSVVDQGCSLPDYARIGYEYVRATSVYDQFALLARFDALWLSDEVLHAYAHAWGGKRGFSEIEINNYADQLLENQKKDLQFYVLSLYEVPLDGQDPLWAISLDIDGIIFVPASIKNVELPIDYLLFFKKNYSRFKLPYLITFNISQDVDLKHARCLRLVLRSSTKQTELSWNLDELNS